ncbi:hypothetical protein M422DRAFT_54556 [Sphaerobolus stellatus SS14]|uniref:non-specific serine/threonine protein kinase n=1 Tax=Sphaerobolus stellatus (strain SS14) TaxID=990650 RepID=A0A0C9UT82_SPHS4|nr:hypothetical protein M422DRAFT_54556 [Sphaerobolus stellatus SS14]
MPSLEEDLSASQSPSSSGQAETPASPLSRNTSAISTISSSSSLVPPRIKSQSQSNYASFAVVSGQSADPPTWLARRFGQEAAKNAPDTNGIEEPIRSVTPQAPAPKMNSVEDFEFGEEIGEGSWSAASFLHCFNVIGAVHKGTGKRYAIKILNKAQLIKQKMVKFAGIEKEALRILSSGKHPGFIRIYSAFQDVSSLCTVDFVLAFAPNGDLRELVKKTGSFSVPCVRYYAAAIVDAVQWMHSKGILHRDLKPENVLIDEEMRTKLTDFGSAYISKDGDLSPRASTFVGSAAYVSPELLVGAVKTTGQSSDIWALGCAIPDHTPSDLRNHQFFVGPPSSEASPSEFSEFYVDWDTLWTVPPPPIEVGLFKAVPPRPEETALASGMQWNDFINQFSLIEEGEEPEYETMTDSERHVVERAGEPTLQPSDLIDKLANIRLSPREPSMPSERLPSQIVNGAEEAKEDEVVDNAKEEVVDKGPKEKDVEVNGTTPLTSDSSPWSTVLEPSEFVQLASMDHDIAEPYSVIVTSNVSLKGDKALVVNNGDKSFTYTFSEPSEANLWVRTLQNQLGISNQ